MARAAPTPLIGHPYSVARAVECHERRPKDGTVKHQAIAAIVLSAATLGCGDKVCLALPNPVVQANIHDSVTAVPAAYQASLIVAGDGVYDSTFVGPRPDSLSVSSIRSSPPGRTGEYAVRVRRNGYRLWQQTGVHVEGSGCAGAGSVELSVRLQPLP